MLRAGPRTDVLLGGAGTPDDCDGEVGIDAAVGCEILSNVP
jgi:hypothetical protein